jgi:hypothetical protein
MSFDAVRHPSGFSSAEEVSTVECSLVFQIRRSVVIDDKMRGLLMADKEIMNNFI